MLQEDITEQPAMLPLELHEFGGIGDRRGDSWTASARWSAATHRRTTDDEPAEPQQYERSGRENSKLSITNTNTVKTRGRRLFRRFHSVHTVRVTCSRIVRYPGTWYPGTNYELPGYPGTRVPGTTNRFDRLVSCTCTALQRCAVLPRRWDDDAGLPSRGSQPSCVRPSCAAEGIDRWVTLRGSSGPCR